MHAHHAVPAGSKDGSARICNRDFPKFAAYGTGDFAVQSNFQRGGEDDPVHVGDRTGGAISIHIPRVGDDGRQARLPLPTVRISIHIPRVGDDALAANPDAQDSLFQSTSPVWGMTYGVIEQVQTVHDFNPHPPCGG